LKILPAHTQQPGALGYVPTGGGESLDNLFSFKIFQRFYQGILRSDSAGVYFSIIIDCFGRLIRVYRAMFNLWHGFCLFVL
jgi:hypothetical protein